MAKNEPDNYMTEKESQLSFQKKEGESLAKQERIAFVLIIYADEIAECYDCTPCHAERVIQKAQEKEEGHIRNAMWDSISTAFREVPIDPLLELLDISKEANKENESK